MLLRIDNENGNIVDGRLLSLNEKKAIIDSLRHKSKQYTRPQDPVLLNNKELKGLGKGKRAFILATGPSVNEQDLTKLEGEDCFSVSNFFLHKDINIIRPKLHFFAPYHEPLILENYIQWLNMADEKLPEDTNIVLALSNKYIKEKYNLFPNRKIYYLDLLYLFDLKVFGTFLFNCGCIVSGEALFANQKNFFSHLEPPYHN